MRVAVGQHMSGRLDWQHVSRPLFPFDHDVEPEIGAVIGHPRQ